MVRAGQHVACRVGGPPGGLQLLQLCRGRTGPVSILPQRQHGAHEVPDLPMALPAPWRAAPAYPSAVCIGLMLLRGSAQPGSLVGDRWWQCVGLAGLPSFNGSP